MGRDPLLRSKTAPFSLKGVLYKVSWSHSNCSAVGTQGLVPLFFGGGGFAAPLRASSMFKITPLYDWSTLLVYLPGVSRPPRQVASTGQSWGTSKQEVLYGTS